jgi:formylmethanofuran dehydrogenase subunit E
MKAQTKTHSASSVSVNCQCCHKDFVIEPDDFSFYEKIKVPPPTWCPECRLIRRFAFQNTWNLSWRNCSKCGERTLSVYSPEQNINIYCQPCWWRDDWDGTEFAMDYDPNRPFLAQVKELMDKTPYSALTSLYTSNKNCDYANALAWSKDCYMVFWADFCENVYYSSLLNTLKNSLDCVRGYNSELCYESVGFSRNYRTFFSEESDDCIDVWFSRNCYNCTNCIGCVNLRGASNCIFNVKYSKEEYAEKVKALGLESWQNIQELRKKAQEFWLTKPYREYKGHSLNLNTTGDYVYESKNSKEMYISNGAENCKWCQFITVAPARDCRDYSGWGNNANRIYEGVTVGENADSVYFSLECWPDVLNLQYCSWNIAGKNNFGCVNLKRKQHCILNKEYSKEEFELLKGKIIEDMKVNPYIDSKGRKFPYGEFFPPNFSRFAYNKSNAMRFFPKDQTNVSDYGGIWSDSENPTSVFSIDASQLPQKISETPETILKEIIGCSACKRAYKVVKGEYDLLRKMNLPLPHECPKCRENKRFTTLDKIKLYNRTCAKCAQGIITPYSISDPRIVYCVSCYQQEFI